MLCDCCKVHEAKISMAGEGHYCMDCHNARMIRPLPSCDCIAKLAQGSTRAINNRLFSTY